MSSSSNNTVAMPQASDSSDPASNLPGSSCHQCKSRRAKPDLVFCTNILDKKSKSCRKKYCEHCLRKFYSEDAPTAGDERGCWSCPSCRGLCCCAACRRRQEKLIKKSGGTLPRGMIPLPPKNGVKRKASSSPVESDDDDEDDDEKSTFAVLYAVSQMPAVKEMITEILAKEDICDQDKVETIASLLRGAVNNE